MRKIYAPKSLHDHIKISYLRQFNPKAYLLFSYILDQINDDKTCFIPFFRESGLLHEEEFEDALKILSGSLLAAVIEEDEADVKKVKVLLKLISFEVN